MSGGLSGDPEVPQALISCESHANALGVYNAPLDSIPAGVEGEMPEIGGELVTPETAAHACEVTPGAPADGDMVSGAYYAHGHRTLAYGMGVETGRHFPIVESTARNKFLVIQHQSPDARSDYMTDEELLYNRMSMSARKNLKLAEFRKIYKCRGDGVENERRWKNVCTTVERQALSIPQLLEEGRNVYMRFPWTPVQHHRNICLKWNFNLPCHTLKRVLSMAGDEDFAAITIPLKPGAIRSQFSDVVELLPDHFHAAIQEVSIVQYQTTGMPISLSATLCTKIPSQEQKDASAVSHWFAHNTVCSDGGSFSGFTMMANTTMHFAHEKVVFVGDYELMCTPPWTRWAQVNLDQELAKITQLNGNAVITFNSVQQVQALDPIQYEVARNWDELYPDIAEMIHSGACSITNIDDVVRVTGMAPLQEVRVTVPYPLLVKFLKKKADTTNRGRHMACLDNVYLQVKPSAHGGWGALREFVDSREGLPSHMCDPRCTVSMTVKVKLALAVREENVVKRRMRAAAAAGCYKTGHKK